MNGLIIAAIVAGGIGAIGGGLKIAEYSYVYYKWKQQAKILEQNKKIREDFKQRLLEYIVKNPDEIDLNYLIKSLLSNDPKEVEKAKKYLVDKGLIDDSVELVRY